MPTCEELTLQVLHQPTPSRSSPAEVYPPAPGSAIEPIGPTGLELTYHLPKRVKWVRVTHLGFTPARITYVRATEEVLLARQCRAGWSYILSSTNSISWDTGTHGENLEI